MSLEDMVNYIKKNAPQDKDWFLKQAFVTRDIKKKGVVIGQKEVYNHLSARKAFCEKYMPEIIPVKKVKTKATDILKNW